MNTLEYYESIKKGIWVPKKGEIVAYHPIIGEPAESNGHTVESVFPARSGKMVAFITGKRSHIAIEALSRDLPERGAMK
jgi:hypothetical protein